jgi:hypothetical protein
MADEPLRDEPLRDGLQVYTSSFTTDCDLCGHEVDDIVTIDREPWLQDKVPWVELCRPCAEVLTQRLLTSKLRDKWHG